MPEPAKMPAGAVSLDTYITSTNRMVDRMCHAINDSEDCPLKQALMVIIRDHAAYMVEHEEPVAPAP